MCAVQKAYKIKKLKKKTKTRRPQVTKRKKKKKLPYHEAGVGQVLIRNWSFWIGGV